MVRGPSCRCLPVVNKVAGILDRFVELCRTNYDVSLGSGIGDYVEAVVVAFHDFHLRVSLLEICGYLAQEDGYFIFRMSGSDGIEDCAAYVACRAGAEIQLSRCACCYVCEILHEYFRRHIFQGCFIYGAKEKLLQ